MSVADVHGPANIANTFKNHFKVDVCPEERTQVFDSGAGSGDITVQFTAKEVKLIITGMKRGKSPDHDGLSIEHLQLAGNYLPRVLAMFFNICVNHCYLPSDLMYTSSSTYC